MILETLRITADALNAGGATPLSTALAAVPRDVGDPLPATPPVHDPTRDSLVAVGRPPAALPAIAVTLDAIDGIKGDSTQQYPDPQIALLFRYYDRDTNAAAAFRDACYIMRALEHCLVALFGQNRVRNGVAVFANEDRQYVGNFAPVEGQWCALAMRVVVSVRDTTF